ncbi:helix-turn-helix domain-containing protein [Halorubrum sp. Ib24]|uniref:helix-turn-helix domain-containing protein n=1 Tax=unclassified Halorubrum TaxID=2642239 RepID=UPI000B99D2B2|nr:MULTISPECIES: helix-turn-helix domain-containing protein [unclassified Halorubrum]OYR42135.1 helix-turn-helix domain-containing protein [Halorubrum sp. Ib24]OYR42604.1 helix-turn-helix domain-containing protein [Halorubrum sp. Eb13]OYR45731.1 helix-turn-helix domain-containing protein [Halorubrum sp. Hd13]OYR49149.1 helix-turn-helix domain-containing protein [Halorubrum sp. Ea1]
MREVTLLIRHRGGPESEVSTRHPEVTMRSVSSMTGRGTERKRIVELRGPTEDIESFIDEFRAADAVVEAEPLSPVTGNHAYVAVVVDSEGWEGIRGRLSEMGIHYRTGTTITAGIERWTVYIEADDDLAAMIRELERGDNDVELARNVEMGSIERPPGLPASGILDGLTPRQREVLSTAIAVGYYDHGSGVGVEDVGDELGLGSTTVWEHLSRAESTVMNALFNRFEGQTESDRSERSTAGESPEDE